MRLLHLLSPAPPPRLARGSDACPPAPGRRARSSSAASPGRTGRSSTPIRAPSARRPARDAARVGAPAGAGGDLPRPDPEADRAAVEAAFERLAAFSPALAGTSDPTEPRSGCSRPRSTGSRRCGVPSRTRRAASMPWPSRRPARPPRAGIAGTRFAATVPRPPRPSCPVGPRCPARVASRRFLAPLPASLLTPTRTSGPGSPVRPSPDRAGRGAPALGAGRPASATRAPGSHGRAPAARRPTRSGRAALRSALSSRSRSSPPSRTSSRSGSSCAGSPPPSPTSSAPGAAARPGRPASQLDLAFAPAGTPPSSRRAPLPRAHRRRRGDRAAAPRPARARAAARSRGPPGAGARRGRRRRPASSCRCSCPRRPGARLGWQLARLALTYGEDRIRRVELVDPEAPLPERRWAWRSVTGRDEQLRGTRPGDRPMTRLLHDHPPIGVELERRPARRDRLGGPARAGRGLQPLAGRRVVVARPDRARLLQGRRPALAGARLPRSGRRDLAPRATVRLTLPTGPLGQRSPGSNPSPRLTTNRIARMAATRTSAPRSRGRADCTMVPLSDPTAGRSGLCRCG